MVTKAVAGGAMRNITNSVGSKMSFHKHFPTSDSLPLTRTSSSSSSSLGFRWKTQCEGGTERERGAEISQVVRTMSGYRNSHGKRSHSELDYAENGGSKRRNAGEDREQYVPGPEDTVYRYLCPGRKIGSIIGRGGEIVKQLRAESRSKIRIGDSVPGCDERVITIFSSSEETNSYDERDDICPAQVALFKIYERLVQPVTDDASADEDDAQVTARLLVPSDQIGCIIGKGGQIIQGIRNDSGAQVRVLKTDIPPCALSGDELLQITGDASVVKKALRQVSDRLHDNPSRSQHILTSSVPPIYPPSSHYDDLTGMAPVIGIGPVVGHYGGYKGDRGGEWSSFPPPSRDKGSGIEFSIRLLCPSANLGGVIGKGGSIIKQIRQDSGAYIKVNSSTAEDDCIISISAKEFFDEPVSPTIDACVRLQPRCSEKTEREFGEPSYTTRLLVPTTRIGCLIGKGGSIISDMRRITRANIRILSKENLPKVAADDDEMVQIGGELDVARSALIQVATRLKANVFERENSLSAFPPPIPYLPIAPDVNSGSRYGSRDGKADGRGYSSYSGGYGSSDIPSSENYTSRGSSQSGSGYGRYGGYSSGRSGDSGLSGPNPISHGKHHGY